MITVRGAKSTSEPTDPAAPYARKPEEKSGAVGKIGLLIVSVVLAFKAFLSGGTKAAEGPEPEKAAEDEAQAPGVTVISGGRAATEPEAVGRAAESMTPAAFEFTPEADTIAFGAQRQIASPLFQPASYVAQQANDNAAPGMTSSPLQGPSGSPYNATGRGPALQAPEQERGPGPSTPVDPIVSDPKPSVPPTGEVPGNGAPQTPDTGPAPDQGPGGDRDNDQDQDRDGDSDSGDGAPDQGANRAPRLSGPVYLNDISGCAMLVIGLSDLLRGAVDPDGDLLSVADVTASSGKLTMVGPGLWEFSPKGELGPVTISYRIGDGSLEVNQTLHFAVLPMQGFGGTDQDDILIGTLCTDEIDAGAGDDLIDGLAGDDIIRGDAGDDHVLASAGNDFVHGGAGDDVIFGGAGHDEIRGGCGNDRLFGDQGDDTLIGGSGVDLVRGGEGNDHTSGGAGYDHLLGEAGDDVIFGNGGEDVIEGGDGNDRLMGGAGNDALIDGAGEDVVLGGDGDDRVVAAADGLDDRYDGGRGCDLLDYSAAKGNLAVDLVAGQASGIEIGDDLISGFERIASGSGDDVIRFGGRAVSIWGGEGCNTFEFAASEDAAAPDPPSRTSYAIEDFKVGDRIKVSQWEIFKDGFADPENMVDRVYGGGAEEESVPIRYSTEWLDAVNETVIEADLDGDDFYETSIILDGRHSLALAETA